MRTKIKAGEFIQVESGLVAGSEELSLTQYFGHYFRKKYRPVRELSDLEFLSLFDIKTVNGLLNTGYNLKSTAAFVEHFKSRVASEWLQPPAYLADLGINTDLVSDNELIARADQVLNYDLEWSGVPPELSCCGEIDWQKNILNNREWLARLNRHSWWPLLGHAYQRTGQERYAMAFARQMSHWVASLDTLDPVEAKHVWSRKQVAMRLRVSWIPAFGMFFQSPYFNTARKLEMLRAIFDQARFLSKQKTDDCLVLNGALASAGITFPELRESGSWRKTAIKRCRASLRIPNRESSSADQETNDFRYSVNLLAFSDRELASVG